MRILDAIAVIVIGIPLGIFVVIQIALAAAIVLGAPFMPVVLAIALLSAGALIFDYVRSRRR